MIKIKDLFLLEVWISNRLQHLPIGINWLCDVNVSIVSIDAWAAWVQAWLTLRQLSHMVPATPTGRSHSS